jgi:hypothetical protein
MGDADDAPTRRASAHTPARDGAHSHSACQATDADRVAATAAGAAGAVAVGDQGDVAERQKPSENVGNGLI